MTLLITAQDICRALGGRQAQGGLNDFLSSLYPSGEAKQAMSELGIETNHDLLCAAGTAASFARNRQYDLLRLHHALTAALPYVGSRALADGPTAAELAVEAVFTDDIEPALADNYRYPLRRGLTAVPDVPRDELLAWLRDEVSEPAATASMTAVLDEQLLAAANVGGQLALDELSLSGTFDLRNEALLERVAAWSISLVAIDAEISLVSTTANDLARVISNGRADDLTSSELSSLLGRYITARTAVRAANIGFGETVRMTRRHLLHGYGRNGVRVVTHRMLRENRPYPDCACPELEGTEYAISSRNPFSNIPEEGLIPVHARCNCYYEAGLAGWEAPEEVWTGE